MKISRNIRRLTIVVHTAASVGWLGAAVILLVLTSGVVTGDLEPAAAYPAAARIGTMVVVPLSLLALLTGLVLALGTHWGVFRHWWVTVKLATTALMTVLVLGLLMPALRTAADTGAALPPDEQSGLMIGPSVSSGLLMLNLVLSVYRPGRSRAGRRPARQGALVGAAPARSR
ncbi:hypothetical protein [Phytoactinopolyspora endophytica]|uniref:hypothetical protein n=1 Tax=Phytoactinopolyspora endophytica TaxID=1642495 RepID=UPI00101DBFCE|nr:hypothetical protein [Phytoactinopolyspora endophytica]